MAVGSEDLTFLQNGVEELVEYDKQCSLFLERMRHSSSFELVQKFKSFVNVFVGTQHSTADDCSQAILSFIEDIAASISEHPLWREEGVVMWDWATEAAERYLLTKLFKMTFVLPCTTDIADDKNFYHRVRTLQFLKPSHFDIPEHPLNRVAMEMAAQELHRADGEDMHSPKEKLTCILNCITILSNLLKHYGNEHNTGADDLLPYLIYTILFLSPKNMHSNIRFISRFRRQSKMGSEAAYYFTQMESAVLFITDADHRYLTISEEEFTQGIEHCEGLIQSKQDVGQFVSSSSGTSDSTHRSSRQSFLLKSPEVAKPSPILARKAGVIEEWSNLQRTRALSQPEAVLTPPTSGPIPVGGSNPLSVSPIAVGTSGATSGPPMAVSTPGPPTGPPTGDEKTQDRSKVKKEINEKFISARFEELTVCDLMELHNNYKALATSQQLQPV